jgi:hypothetical protein
MIALFIFMIDESNFEKHSSTQSYITYYPVAYFALVPIFCIGLFSCIIFIGDEACGLVWATCVALSYFVLHYSFLVCTIIFLFEADYFTPKARSSTYLLYLKVYSIVSLVSSLCGIETYRLRAGPKQTNNRTPNYTEEVKDMA